MNQNYLNLIKLYKDNKSTTTNYYDALEGYAKGNMNKALYNSYKGLNPTNLDANNPYILLGAYQFAIIDLQLYLDMHPDDKSAKELFDKYLNLYIDTKKTFVANNIPLTIDCETNLKQGFNWQKNWPFERRIN